MAAEVWFDVYGKFLIRLRAGPDGWLVAHRRRPDGRFQLIDGLVIPNDASSSEIRDAVDVRFHESALPGAEIRRLQPPDQRASRNR